jgi:predicted metal-binding membrane protein
MSAGHRHGAQPWWAVVVAGQLMTVAMMAPAGVPAVRYVWANTLSRWSAVGSFLVGYLAVWSAFSAAASGSRVLAVPALLLAAGWQLTRVKRRCLRRCHTAVVLPAQGVPAVACSLRYGLRHGLYCVGTCWALRLVMLAAGPGRLAWMAGIAALVYLERFTNRARALARPTAVAFAVLAVATLVS